MSGPNDDAILDAVAKIPRGRVMTYGDIAEYVGVSSARMVGRVLAFEGESVPWHRVVKANGSFADHLRLRQLELLRAEGVPLRGDRVDLAAARWDGK